MRLDGLIVRSAIDHCLMAVFYVGGLHRQTEPICTLCAGCLPYGEECKACGRVNLDVEI